MVQLIQKPQAIAFDWDGTLADTREVVTIALNHTLALYGKETWEAVRLKQRNPMKSLKENFQNFFGADAFKAYKTYLTYYRTHCLHDVHPMRGAGELLQYLKQHAVSISIISNKEKSLLISEIQNCFPNIVFNAVLGNGDASQNKPAPDPIWTAYAMAPFDINPQNVWMVGDARVDFESAVTANCLPILIGPETLTRQIGALAQLEKTKQAYLFKDLTDFLNHLTWDN